MLPDRVSRFLRLFLPTALAVVAGIALYAQWETASIATLQANGWIKLLAAVALLLGLIGLGSWKLACAWSAQARAETEARTVNAQLQQLVNEKTHTLEAQVAELDLAAGVFKHAQEGITITDLDGNIIAVNDAFERITGYSRAEVLGRNPRMLQSGRQGREFYAAMWRDLTSKGHWYGEIWNRRKDGAVYAEMLKIAVIRDTSGAPQRYVGIFSDITAFKEHQKQLEHLAHYDALTALPNRVLLADRLQQAIAQTRRRGRLMAVAYLDLDGFKAVNDLHGHDIGDELLIIVARRLREALREDDTLARLGGDEFVAVLADLGDTQECEEILQRLLRAADAPVNVRDHVLQVSASVGVTLYPLDNGDPDMLMRHADQAMYQAKQAGKNRYHLFDAEHDRKARSHRESLQRIAQALEDEEFVIHYQPRVNLRSGEVIGAEALIRWQHPTRGLLAPGQFLPAVEEHDLIARIGDWVLTTAVAQLAAWHRAGLEITVSVNIAARHLQREGFVDRLREQLAAWPDLPASRLELEVLESAALEDLGRVSRIVEACRAIGVEFSLDDFGTGYSSLTYLKRLQASILKIDQSFVRDMLWDPEDLAIIEGIIGLSLAFRRTVVAEGVETVAHGETLLRLGCDCAQGFGIARPMPASQLPEWTRTWRPDAVWSAWRDRSPHPDDLNLVIAEVEHRHWIRMLENHLAGLAEAAPSMAPDRCRFVTWYQGEGHLQHGHHAAFRTIGALHERLHAAGSSLIELKARNQLDQALARLPELRAIGGELIGELHRLSTQIAIRRAE